MNVVPIAAEYIEIGQLNGAGYTAWMMSVMGSRFVTPNGGNYTEFYATKDEAVAAATGWELPIVFSHGVGTVTRTPEEYPPLSTEECYELIEEASKTWGYLEAAELAAGFALPWPKAVG